MLAAGGAAPAAAAHTTPANQAAASTRGSGAHDAHTTPANQGAASTRGSGAHDAVSTSHTEVPMIRQIAPESSDASLQPSTSGTSIIRFFLLAPLPVHHLSSQICNVLQHASFYLFYDMMYAKY